MRIIIEPMIGWSFGALVMILFHSSLWAEQFNTSLFTAFIGMALPFNIITISMALIGTVIQSLFIKIEYFHLGVTLSILVVSIATILTLLILPAIIMGFEGLIVLLEDGGIYLILSFVIPCFVITTVVYLFTRPSNTVTR